ncbi:hypothetical protein [Nonomuraea guangzhouensis]|uniref:Uncharacterized protein n=1 Tax=Nonomuraea guangzhouensis TaxID=1291555 RepID=A0ABW4GW20_9ACTN|nr:hypothetical protein [Nonomuraea guangzhouensis]
MTELVHSSGGDLVPANGGDGGGVIYTIVRYAVLRMQFAVASWQLSRVADHIDGTFDYIEECADSVLRIADQMAKLTVDPDTTGEHRQAAAVMKAILADAQELVDGKRDLAVLFETTWNAHETDYGPVADTIAAMPVPMAEAEFYSNR